MENSRKLHQDHGKKMYASMISSIREKRKDLKLTQKDLASMIGINATKMSNIETGKEIPNADMIFVIMSALDVSCYLKEIDKSKVPERTGFWL